MNIGELLCESMICTSVLYMFCYYITTSLLMTYVDKYKIEGATQCITLVIVIIIIVVLVIVVGDGAGVGKGRTIAGIIYQNYLEGRKKALW